MILFRREDPEWQEKEERINKEFDELCEQLKKIPISKKKMLLNTLKQAIFKKQQTRRF